MESISATDSIDLVDRIRVNEFKIMNQIEQISSLERKLKNNNEVGAYQQPKQKQATLQEMYGGQKNHELV